ncbi:Uncharacterised protein [Mycobacteroides abscessus subsp. abscessus]|nr:Uncharacterised protein [Mycobacteroides abscessus subsp. abscessus]
MGASKKVNGLRREMMLNDGVDFLKAWLRLILVNGAFKSDAELWFGGGKQEFKRRTVENVPGCLTCQTFPQDRCNSCDIFSIVFFGNRRVLAPQIYIGRQDLECTVRGEKYAVSGELCKSHLLLMKPRHGIHKPGCNGRHFFTGKFTALGDSLGKGSAVNLLVPDLVPGSGAGKSKYRGNVLVLGECAEAIRRAQKSFGSWSVGNFFHRVSPSRDT